MDPIVVAQKVVDEKGEMIPFAQASESWDGSLISQAPTFLTGIGSTTTYPDYKPAPFIVGSDQDGVDMITVVSEGVFSYCGVKVKIDTDAILGPSPRPFGSMVSRSVMSRPLNMVRRCWRSVASAI